MPTALKPIGICRLAGLALIALFLVAVAGCGSGSDSGSGGTANVTVTTSLPASIDPATLVAVSSQGEEAFSDNGEVTFTVSDNLPFIMMARSGDTIVAMSLVIPGMADNGISCLNTAVAMVMLRMGLVNAPEGLQADLVEEIASVSEVVDLGDAICVSLAADIKAVEQPDDILKDALTAAEAAVNAHLELLAN